MTGWQIALVLLGLIGTTLGGLWLGRRRGRAEGAAKAASAAEAKARALELELSAVRGVVHDRVAARIEEALSEGRDALARNSLEDLDELIDEARRLRKDLGL